MTNMLCHHQKPWNGSSFFLADTHIRISAMPITRIRAFREWQTRIPAGEMYLSLSSTIYDVSPRVKLGQKSNTARESCLALMGGLRAWYRPNSLSCSAKRRRLTHPRFRDMWTGKRKLIFISGGSQRDSPNHFPFKTSSYFSWPKF